jgi:hypothetical protein
MAMGCNGAPAPEGFAWATVTVSLGLTKKPC